MKKKLTEGPFGIKMKDETAQALEQVIKTLPKAQRRLHRKADVPENTELLPGERADISWVSTESVDREGEVVLASGVDLSYFARNPIIPFAHKYHELPVGYAQWVKIVDGGIKGKTCYSKRPDDWQGEWFPDAVWSMVKEGIIRGKSIGFLPLKLRSPTSDELRQRPDWERANAIVESCILLEWSIAPVPVNQDALVTAVAKGRIDLGTCKALGLTPKLPSKPKVKSKADPVKRLVAELGRVRLDPEEIALKVLHKLASRGKV